MRGRKTGGRTKGTPNKATAARQAVVASSGLTPLNFMLTLMRGEKISQGEGKSGYVSTMEDRKWAAGQAAAYVHPRLSSVGVEHSDKQDVSNLTDAELEEIIRSGRGGNGVAPKTNGACKKQRSVKRG